MWPKRAHERLDPPPNAPLAVRTRGPEREDAAQIDRRLARVHEPLVRIVGGELLDHLVQFLRSLHEVRQLGDLHVPGGGFLEVLLRISGQEAAAGAELLASLRSMMPSA